MNSETFAYLLAGLGILLSIILWGRLLLLVGKSIARLENSVAEIERRQGQGSKIPDEAVQRLADPATLDAELERAGQLSDMRRARRKHLPRENAGPPARVRKLRISRK